MAADNIIHYMLTGVSGEVIPRNATHVSVHPSVTVITARALCMHPNIIELICHEGVKRIEKVACASCPRLRRVIIPGVEVVERYAFNGCKAVIYVECPKLKTIGEWAFNNNESLSDIDLPSVKIIEKRAFNCCTAITNAKFGKELESVGWGAFRRCSSLERVTIPLKGGYIDDDNIIFVGCEKLEHVDLVEGEVLQETIDALLMEEWRNDMHGKLDLINHILPIIHAPAGNTYCEDVGAKARMIREWIAPLLSKILHYKAEHRRLLNAAETTLMQTLPFDIVKKNVLPFLELPSHTFEGEYDLLRRHNNDDHTVEPDFSS